MNFVAKDSIVREIWGSSDTLLFIFAGAAAEFSLNKSVDWLYFTGKLPKDPIGRLFSTVNYSQKILFSDEETALRTIDRMVEVHGHVESARGMKIPEWAFWDVLYMLIYYSIAAFELLHRKLSPEEKEEVFDVFYRLGQRMKLKALSNTYSDWLISRKEHLESNLVKSDLSIDLYGQYKRSLGLLRYWLLLEAQKAMMPTSVRALLGFAKPISIFPMIAAYRVTKFLSLSNYLLKMLLPAVYTQRIMDLNTPKIKG